VVYDDETLPDSGYPLTQKQRLNRTFNRFALVFSYQSSVIHG
jgi:hypothetical protein